MQDVLRTQASSSLAWLCMILGLMVSPLLFLVASLLAWPRARRGHADGVIAVVAGLLLFLTVIGYDIGYGIGKDLALRDNAASPPCLAADCTAPTR